MHWRQWRARARSAVGCAALVFGTSSFIPTASYMVSGAYARDWALAADCRLPYFPALDPADKAVAEANVRWTPPSFRLVTWRPGFTVAGAEAAYATRALVPEPGTVRSERLRSGARLDRYDGPVRAMTVVSSADGSGCTRLVVAVSNVELQIAVDEGTVATSPWLLDAHVPGAWHEARNFRIKADDNPQTLTIRTLVDGRPTGGVRGQVWIEVRGIVADDYAPYLFSRVHQHELSAPTVHIEGDGGIAGKVVPFMTATAPPFEWTAKIWAGYRGGPELIMATAPGWRGRTDAARRPIIARYGRTGDFVEITEGLGVTVDPRTRRVVPTPGFPLLLVGAQDNRHEWNHYFRRTVRSKFLNTLRTIWTQQIGARPAKDQEHWFLANDASLETGGVFKVTPTSGAPRDFCRVPNAVGHKTHNLGVDLDVSPCLSNGATGVRSEACEADRRAGMRRFLHIDERLLAAQVIGVQGGAIYVHSQHSLFSGTDPRRAREHPDGGPYHYHIRIPPSLGSASDPKFK